MNFTPYPVSADDCVLVEIMHNNTFIVSSREYGGQKWAEGNVMKVSFTVREAGTYKISVLARGTQIKGSPFIKTFLPGKMYYCFIKKIIVSVALLHAAANRQSFLLNFDNFPVGRFSFYYYCSEQRSFKTFHSVCDG